MIEAACHFLLEGAPISCMPIGTGHIHNTYRVETDSGASYILQRLNRFVFPNVESIMANLALLEEYLRDSGQPMLQFLNTREGGKLFSDGDRVWRAYPFVPNSVCLTKAERPEALYQGALAFGRFLHALRGFPAERLTETIPHFHDTPDRYRLFREALERDPLGRRGEAERETAFFLEREEKACMLQNMREKGSLPVRVTHNDAKLNNVLLDADTGSALCVIDLDTVMPGLAAYDFGDLIRSGASAAAEDDSCGVRLDLERYRALLRGFCTGCPSLTERELQFLPLGAYTMTVECGLRFLTDFLLGDPYFAIRREKHNLERARSQIALARELERERNKLYQILEEEKS